MARSQGESLVGRAEKSPDREAVGAGRFAVSRAAFAGFRPGSKRRVIGHRVPFAALRSEVVVEAHDRVHGDVTLTGGFA